MDTQQKKSDAKNRRRKKKRDIWPVKVFFITLAIALVLSFLSETVLLGVPLYVAVFVLVFIIFIGILFDIIGVAVTIQDVTAYTAMASKRIRGAKHSISLVQNSAMVANICNDVVGDICGIVSGAMGAAVAASIIISAATTEALIVNVAISALIAAITVSGKASGKRIATKHSQRIVFMVGKLFALFSKNGERKKSSAK